MFLAFLPNTFTWLCMFKIEMHQLQCYHRLQKSLRHLTSDHSEVAEIERFLGNLTSGWLPVGHSKTRPIGFH